MTATVDAVPREACPQLRDSADDVESSMDPRHEQSVDLVGVSLGAVSKATQVRVLLAELADAPEATPLGQLYEVYVRGRSHVFLVRITVSNGAVRGSLWQRDDAQPAADPEAPLNEQGGTFTRLAELDAAYDGKRNHVQVTVPWALAGGLGAGQLLSGLSATSSVAATNTGAAASEQTDALVLHGSADLAAGGRAYVVGTKGC